MTTLEESTKSAYSRNFLKVSELLGIGEDYKQYLKPLKIIKKIDELDRSQSTKKGYLSAILYILKHTLKDDLKPDKKVLSSYSDHINKLNEDLQGKKDENTMTKKEKDKSMGWNDIIKLRDTMDIYANPSNRLNHFILSLYTFIPPRRVQDFSLMKIVKNKKEAKDPKFNYLIHNARGSTFIFNVFKTAKYEKDEDKIVKAPPQLRKIINSYHDCYLGKKYGDFLIKSIRGNELNESNLSKHITDFMERLTGKPIGASQFRHSYISNMEKKTDLTLKERKETAKGMGHSVMTQLEYNKIDL
jgi:integrase